jgi:hypothetical protein
MLWVVLEYMTMDRVQKYNNPKCNIPLPEPVRIERMKGLDLKLHTKNLRKQNYVTSYRNRE